MDSAVLQMTSAFSGAQQQGQPSVFNNSRGDLGYPTDLEQHYAMGDEIGSGSFGAVYSAVRLKDGTPVAVKVWA